MTTGSSVRVIGVDPGPVPGIVVLDVEYVPNAVRWIEHVDVAQCSATLVLDLLRWLVADVRFGTDVLLQVERFVVRGRSNAAQQLTRTMAADLLNECRALPGVTAVERPAVAVKPWATDVRLEAAGLAEATKGMRHARDAARHALFCAVHDAGLPDPLSKAWRA